MLTNLPFTLPDWMPGWVFLLLALQVLLYALVFLLMPFSVFGVKARIEALETQIEALHEELRVMAMRAAGIIPPATPKPEVYEDVPDFARFKKSQRAAAEPPPAPAREVTIIPPMPQVRDRLAPDRQAPPPRPTRRTEPRLD